MTQLTPDERHALVREAARAPSVHNIQPARWRFGDGEVTLLRAPGRELPIGDPTGHDLAASLGAAWEGMSIALSRIGYALGAPARVDAGALPGDVVGGRLGEGALDGDDAGRDGMVSGRAGGGGTLPHRGGPTPDPEIAARARVAPPGIAHGRDHRSFEAAPIPCAHATVVRGGVTTDPLAAYVWRRRSHRGRFQPPDDDARARLRSIAAEDACIIDERAFIDDVAALHDDATWHFESNPAYHAELWSWLRLSPRDARWSRDGLNADCLAITRVERAAARIALRPPVFALLARLGVARTLVSEAAQVRGAAGLLLFAPDAALPAFDVGRRFYRLWLELTAAGLHAAPMSATSDWAVTRESLVQRCGIPRERRLANVLRVGVVAAAAESPRLPVDELMG